MNCPVLTLLVLINAGVFVYCLYDASPYVDYSLSRHALENGDFSVLLTYMFLHGSLLHLVVNMLGLISFGYLLERKRGSGMFLTIYILSGIFAGLFFVTFETSSAIGASGAVFGVLAASALLTPFQLSFYPFLIPLPLSLLAVVYTIITVLLLGSGGIVAHSAHLGGLFSGAVLALLLWPEDARRGLLVSGLIAFIILVLPILL